MPPLSLADRILSYRDVVGRHGGLRRAQNDEGAGGWLRGGAGEALAPGIEELR